MGLLSPRTEGFLYFADVVDLFAVASSGGPLATSPGAGSVVDASLMGLRAPPSGSAARTPLGFRQETPGFVNCAKAKATVLDSAMAILGPAVHLGTRALTFAFATHSGLRPTQLRLFP